MSNTTQGTVPTSKLAEEKKGAPESTKAQQDQPPALLEEDDEFEDFPVEGLSLSRARMNRAPVRSKKYC